MKYLRRIPNATNKIYSNWHEVTEFEAQRQARLGVPKHSWNRIQEWYDQGTPLFTAYAIYRKVNDEMAERMLKEDYFLKVGRENGY